MQRRLEKQTPADKQQDPQDDQDAEEQGEIEEQGASGALGAPVQRQSKSKTAINQQRKQNGHKPAKEKKQRRRPHAALALLHIREIVCSKEIIEPIEKIHDGRTRVALLEPVLAGSGVCAGLPVSGHNLCSK